MAFPWTFHENFENGTLGNFNSETDSGGYLNIRNYKRLARTPYAAMPYRGAYCAEINLAQANSYFQEDDGFDISASGSLYIRFLVYLASNVVMANNDRFTVFALQSAGPTDEVVVDIRYTTAAGYEILACETGSGATVRNGSLIRDAWHTVELAVTIDAGGANNGTVDFYLDGSQIGAQLASLDQGAIVQARYGAMGRDSGTTGSLYLGEIVADDARIYPYAERFANPRTLTKSEHLFVGPGWLEWAGLLSSNADDQILLYDTDEANVNDAQGLKVELYSNSSFLGPVFFGKGCYASMSGTGPRGQFYTAENSDRPGVVGPVAITEAGLRMVAMR